MAHWTSGCYVLFRIDKILGVFWNILTVSFLLGIEYVEFYFSNYTVTNYISSHLNLFIIYNYICHPFLKTANTTTKVLQFSVCQNYLTRIAEENKLYLRWKLSQTFLERQIVLATSCLLIRTSSSLNLAFMCLYS